MRTTVLSLTLLLAACGSLPRPDLGVDDDAGMDAGVVEPDLGARDAGPPDGGPDVGPLDRGPIPDLGTDPDRPLAPLDLIRVTPGLRLAPLLYVLPGGHTEPRTTDLYDSLFELGCFVTDQTEGGFVRCMPRGLERDIVYADERCEAAAGLLRGDDSCDFDTYVTEAREVAGELQYRLHRETGAVLAQGYSLTDGACGPFTPGFGTVREAERVPDPELVGAIRETRPVQPGVHEVVTTFEDGTVAVERALDEPCQRYALSANPDVFRCIDAEPRRDVFLRYADAGCADPIVGYTADESDVPAHFVLFGAEPGSIAIRPVTGGIRTGIQYQLDENGACQPDGDGPGPYLQLGAEVPPTMFPAVTRVPGGRGRVQPYRYVDSTGLAWPFPPEQMFYDADLDLMCEPRRTDDGVRCLPRAWARRSGRFVDDRCREQALSAPEPVRYDYARIVGDSFPIGCRVYRSIHPGFVGGGEGLAALDVVDLTYERNAESECVAAEDDGLVYHRVGAEVPITTFAEIELTPL